MTQTENSFPLTATQQGMLLATQRHGVDCGIQQIVVKFDRKIDLAAAGSAWGKLTRRHRILRSRVVLSSDGSAYHEVEDEVRIAIRATSTNDIKQFLEEDLLLGVDVSRAPAYRLSALDLPDGQSVLVFTHHHTMLDGASQRVVIEEFFELYDGGTPRSAEHVVEFAEHCRAYAARDREAERGHFMRVLDGVVPTAFPRFECFGREHGTRGARGEVQHFIEIPDTLRPFGESEVSFGTLLQAAWAAALSAYCGVEDVVFGVTRNGRHLVDGSARMVGCAINTVPVRVAISGSDTVRDLALQIYQYGIAVRPFEQASLSEIQGSLELDVPLFDSFVVYDHGTLQQHFRSKGGRFADVTFELHQRNGLPLLLAGYRCGTRLELALEHDESLWGREVMATLLQRVGHIYAQMLASPEMRVGEIQLLLPGEMAPCEYRPAAAAGKTPATNVTESIFERAKHYPQSTAYVDASGVATTYEQLRELCVGYTALLRKVAGDIPGAVALVADRSASFLAMELACFGSGFVVVPIDSRWPLNRMADVIDAARPRLVLVQDAALRIDMHASLEGAGLNESVIASWPAPGEFEHDDVPAHEPWASGPCSEEPAYVIFTSGSTGTPKGVVTPHRALAAHASAATGAFELTASDRVLQFASPAFDVALEEAIPALLAGSALVERPESATADLDEFLEFIDRHRVSVLNLPSAYFHVLVQHLVRSEKKLGTCVRLVIIGSDKPTAWSIEQFIGSHSHVRLLNAYGPTEATITCLVADLTAAAHQGQRGLESLVGGPFGTCSVHLLDRHLRECPPGVLGEICIVGPQVATGYLNSPDIENARFVRYKNGQHRMYCSGDLARRRPDGNIEFVGRTDDQVKIRGVRIELREVEHQIVTLAGISSATVVVRDLGAGNELVAFVVLDAGCKLDPPAIKTELAERLPASFVPAEIRCVETFPVRANGKLDLERLRQLASRAAPVVRSVAAPANDIETYILQIFIMLLEREDIGVADNFFEVGGHSLLAVRLLGEINRIAPEPLSLAAVFAKPSVRGLATQVSQGRGRKIPSVLPLNTLARQRMNDTTSGHEWPAPAFLLSGVQIYSCLATSLSKDRPVFGVYVELEQRMFLEARPDVEVAAIAAAYIDAIRATQPDGPYVLGGVSFGGLIAFEVAQQLKSRGEDVQLLILLDPILPRAIRPRGWNAKLRRLAGDVVKRLSMAVYGLGGRAGARLRRAQKMSRSTDASVQSLGRIRDDAYRLAAERYDKKVRPYDGPAIIFRSRHAIDKPGMQIDWDLGWADLLPHVTPVFGVEGDHLGILLETGSREIARILRQHTAPVPEAQDEKLTVRLPVCGSEAEK